MFEGFEELDIEVPDRGFGKARIRLKHGGSGPPLLLLHGNPMTHVSWHKMVPELMQHYHVVATDLRGYGDSYGPEEAGENNIHYSFRAMAMDQVFVMEHLGYAGFQVAGHDRGARVAHRMCLDHPEKVQRAAFLDILPSRHIWHNVSLKWAMKSWHWIFMALPPDMPERMMGGVPPEYFIEKKVSKPGVGMRPFTDEALAEYIRCFTPKTIAGSCNDYRACVTCDLEMDDADFDAGKRVECPLIVLWGKNSHTGQVYGDILPIWQQYAKQTIDGEALDSGHYVPEDAPEATLKWFDGFFDKQAEIRRIAAA